MDNPSKGPTILALAVVAAAWLLADRLALPDEMALPGGEVLYRGRVVAPPAQAATPPADVVYVRPSAGPFWGRKVPATYAATAGGPLTELTGRSVFVAIGPDGRGVVRSLARDRLLLALAAGLAGLIVVIAGRSAGRLLAVLVGGIACLFAVLVPALAAGVPPVAAGLLTAGVFVLAAALLIGRAGRLSLGILAGSAGGLAAAAGLALLAVRAGRLTGVYSTLTKDLWYDASTGWLDFRQLLCAGMIVGTCGIVLDLAVAVASAVRQVREANPALPRRRLAAAGLAVGRDVMGTELNTLIFAYAGAHLGVVLLPALGSRLPGYEIPALRIFSQQAVAVEIFQMLAGTIALVVTIPITAAVSALLWPRPAAEAKPAPARAGRARWVVWAAGAAAVAAAWLACTWWHGGRFHRYARRPTDRPGTARYLVQATVVSADPPPAALRGRQTDERMQELLCRVGSGPAAGETVKVPNPVSGFPGHDKLAGAGDAVLLRAWVADGKVTYATVIDLSRGAWLIHVTFLLVAVVLLVGRGKGLRALVALAVSGAVLYPAALATALGRLPALPVFLAAAVPLCVAVFGILGGPGRQVLAGSAGAFGGLLAGGLCAVAGAAALRLTGLASDSMMAIRLFTGSRGLDYAGLLQAGMVLGIVGAGMDVAMAVVSGVQQVRRAKPDADRSELLARGLAIGRGVMIPMVLALLLAYVGLSLPILILPKMLPDQPVSLLLSNERISVEILRILVGGIGVVATVPITAAIASGLGGRGKGKGHANSGGADGCPPGA